MRVAVVLTAVTVLLAGLAAFALFGLSGSRSSCDLFEADLYLAVMEPTKAPDPDDDGSFGYGSCSSVRTTKIDAHVPGWDRHSEHTIAGRINVDYGDRKLFDGLMAAYREERDVRVTPLPSLGPGAVLVTRRKPEAQEPDLSGAPSDPASALPLLTTAYWANDPDGYSSVSATRDGATVEQSQLATTRLAELVNRRPIRSGESSWIPK